MSDDNHRDDPPSPGERDDEALWDGEESRIERAMRWRLILGQFADERLSYNRLGQLSSPYGDLLTERLQEAQMMDTPLSYIYDREFARRSHRQASGGGGSGISVPAWLSQVRRFFPKEACHIIEQDALLRYNMTELVTDPEILRNSEPTEDLLKAIIQFKHMMKGDVLEAAREVVRAVVDRIAARLLDQCRPALHGVIDPTGSTPPIRSFRNVDWRRTIQRNLKHYNTDRDALVIDRLFFKHRQRNKRSWNIIVAVDQSGSMTDSLIHSAIMAAIFASLPAVEVHLVLWDHRVFDVSDMIDDPMEVLMGCQLGGGTQMLPAMQYCSGLIRNPERTIFVILSDWHIWSEEGACLAMAHELTEAGVTGIGLNALDSASNPIYNEKFARQLAGCGWSVATMTPKQLAEHIGKLLG